MCARIPGVGGTCVLTGGCAFGAQRLCLRGPETFFALRLAACKAPQRCAQRRRSVAAPRGPTPTRSVLFWLPAPPRSLAPPPPNGRPPPRGGMAAWWGGGQRGETAPPGFALAVGWSCMLSGSGHSATICMTPACPRPPRALSRAQPKWEQAVRRVLRKDEHVVFAVIGGWVRAALCKRSWVAETLPPRLRIGRAHRGTPYPGRP